MKHTRVKATSSGAVSNTLAVLSPLATLIPLVGVVVSLAEAVPARGAEVTFTERVISNTAYGVFSVFAVDLDGDGDTDVLSASQYDDKVAWYENDGGSPPHFREHVISTDAADAISVYATDVDGDGDTDVLSASQSDDKIAWYENDGATPPSFTERIISNSRYNPMSVIGVDMDGDGDTDVLSVSFWSSKVSWFENSGSIPPTFDERIISTWPGGARSVYASDLDLDGDTDILGVYTLGHRIVWYENDGDSPPDFIEHLISTDVFSPVSCFASDIDGDGDIDGLSASRFDNKIAWYENDGGSPPAFLQHVVSINANHAQSVYAGDVNGDGNIDILSGSSQDQKTVWYRNDGCSPPNFEEHVIANNDAASVVAIDLDGDGDTDVLSASFYKDSVIWYENTTPLDPTVLLEYVVQQVLVLDLKRGIQKNLIAKLVAAQQALSDFSNSNDVAACNSLRAFINAIDAQAGKQISQDDADALKVAAQEIVVILGCSKRQQWPRRKATATRFR